jgi:hypothetical protein
LNKLKRHEQSSKVVYDQPKAKRQQRITICIGRKRTMMPMKTVYRFLISLFPFGFSIYVNAFSSFSIRLPKIHQAKDLNMYLRISSFDERLEYDRENDEEQEDDDEESIFDVSDHKSDWMQAELTLVKTPIQPHPDMDALQVATLICRSLQFVDYPDKSSGLRRCFEFLSLECRAAVTARQGARSEERFVEYGHLAPALQPFMGATRVELGEATFTEAKPPLRGAVCSFPITIEGAPILSVQHLSGLNKAGVSQPPITNMVIRLEQQRRPPNQNCWMVREIIDVRMAFAGDMGNVHVGG